MMLNFCPTVGASDKPKMDCSLLKLLEFRFSVIYRRYDSHDFLWFMDNIQLHDTQFFISSVVDFCNSFRQVNLVNLYSTFSQITCLGGFHILTVSCLRLVYFLLKVLYFLFKSLFHNRDRL